MANSIIHFLLFGLFFSLIEPDLGLRLRVAGSLSRGLPSSGAASLPRGLPSSGAASLRRGLPSSGAASLLGGIPPFGVASLPGDYRFGAASLPGGLPSFETGCFRVLQGLLRIAVRFRGGYRLPARYRYRGDCRFSKQDAYASCKEEA